MDEIDQLAGCARMLTQLLLASYGLHPQDVAREAEDACRHLGGHEVVLLLADDDQRELVGFDGDDDPAVDIDGSGPGLAFRRETLVEEDAGGGRRRLWIPVKDSAERVGVFGVVDDGSVAPRLWEAAASLLGELIVSKSKYGDHITLRRRRHRSYSLAAEMRWSTLPPLTYTSPDATLAAIVQPSDRIAGDAFDYSVDGRVLSIAIFDAMGHGIEASRMANVAVGCYRNSRRGGAGIVETMCELDQAIATQFGEQRFVTAQMATFDLDGGQLEIVNAGHPLPLHLVRGRPPQAVECAVTLPAGLGSDPRPSTLQLQRGDSILFQSDGVVDARSPAGEFFGDDRLSARVHRLHEQRVPPAEVVRQCVHEIIRHQDGRANDDATLMLLHWSGDTGPATAATGTR